MFHTTSVRQQLCHSQLKESRLHLYLKILKKILKIFSFCCKRVSRTFWNIVRLFAFSLRWVWLLRQQLFRLLSGKYWILNVTDIQKGIKKWMEMNDIRVCRAHAFNNQAQRKLFNKKLCKYCRNRVERQSRKDLHTYENKHRRVIVYKSNNYKSSATWQV